MRSENMRSAVVLVVEDDGVLRSLLSLMLADLPGVRAVVIEDGGEALRMAAECRPSLVLLDVRMAGIDGVELTRQLRATPATKSIPIIAMSAAPASRADALAAGADDFLDKPFDLDDFTRKVLVYLAATAQPRAA